MNQSTDPIPLPLPRVLVLDDDPDTLALYGKALMRMGVDAVPVSTCAAAAQYTASTMGRIDLVIADSRLPDGCGLTVAAALKAHFGCATLIASGDLPPDTGLPRGIDAWRVKPVDLPDLIAAARRLLSAPPGRPAAAAATP